MDTLGKSLEELKAVLDATQAEQVVARKEVAKRLQSLGIMHYGGEMYFGHPTEEGFRIRIEIQGCYFDEKSDFAGYFSMVVEAPHMCDYECGLDCNLEWDVLRDATAEEVVEVIRQTLVGWIEHVENTLKNNWEVAKALPKVEEIDAIRRRVEDHLRKNRKDIIPVARLLDLI